MEEGRQNYLTIAPTNNSGCRLQELRGGHIAHALRAACAGAHDSQGEEGIASVHNVKERSSAAEGRKR